MSPSIVRSALAVCVAAGALAAQAKPAAPAKPAAAKPAAPAAGFPDSLIFGAGLRARSIGPGIMGGRVSALAFSPKEPYTYYVGLATGGVVVTNDNGQTFSPIFDKQPSASIGDIAVSTGDSAVIWVATGEGNDRNSTG